MQPSEGLDVNIRAFSCSWTRQFVQFCLKEMDRCCLPLQRSICVCWSYLCFFSFLWESRSYETQPLNLSLEEIVGWQGIMQLSSLPSQLSIHNWQDSFSIILLLLAYSEVWPSIIIAIIINWTIEIFHLSLKKTMAAVERLQEITMLSEGRTKRLNKQNRSILCRIRKFDRQAHFDYN